MLPEDKKWAIGMVVGIVLFFSMIVLAGRIYLTDIDDDFRLNLSSEDMEGEFTLWLMRNDSKNMPLKVSPPVEDGGRSAKYRIDIQREYIAEQSVVSVQARSPGGVKVSPENPPVGARLEVEVYHEKVVTHRPVIVIEPSANASRSTEIFMDELDPSRVSSNEVEIDADFEKDILGDGYSLNLREDVYQFSGSDEFWKIDAYDSVTDQTVSFNGMALFRIRIRLVVDLEGGSQIVSDWMETQYFAVDLVSPD